MTGLSDAARLDRIEAHIAITDLIHEYARLIRQDEPEGIAALFAPDATFEVRDGHPDKPDYTVRERLEGRDGLNGFYAPMKGNPHPVPLIHNLTIAVDGDTATANSVMEAQVYGTEHRVQGEYHDAFIRVDGRWSFASRIYMIYTASTTI